MLVLVLWLSLLPMLLLLLLLLLLLVLVLLLLLILLVLVLLLLLLQIYTTTSTVYRCIPSTSHLGADHCLFWPLLFFGLPCLGFTQDSLCFAFPQGSATYSLQTGLLHCALQM